MRRDRWKLHLSVAVTVIAAMTLALSPAVADPVPGTDDYPDVAFLARNDVPFDAQTAASMAAQLGAPMFITNPNALSDAAAEGIAGLNPEVIIVAGGEFAVSDDVANAAASACEPDCTVDRRFGTGRDGTAAALAEIAADYGFDRPVLQGSNQVVGDVTVGGTVHADALDVEDTGLVSGLNADRVDGKHADDFLGAGEKAADSELLDGKDSTEFLGASEKATDADLLDGRDSTAFAERMWAVVEADSTLARGHRAVSASTPVTGQYEIAFDTDITECAYIASIGPSTAGNEQSAFIEAGPRSMNAEAVFVETRDIDNNPAARPFHLQVIC